MFERVTILKSGLKIRALKEFRDTPVWQLKKELVMRKLNISDYGLGCAVYEWLKIRKR